MYSIEFANRQDLLELDEKFLLDVVQKTLRSECVRAAEISVALVDNGEIWALNRQFLGHDYATDVLSFSLDEPPDGQLSGESSGAAPPPRGKGRTVSGEVVLSAEMALETAVRYHWCPRDEVALYLVHGLLHLCGYDDLDRGERRIMRTREQEILKHWNLQPRYTARASAPTGDGRRAAGSKTGARK